MSEDASDSSNQQAGGSEQVSSGAEQAGGGSQEQGQVGEDPRVGVTPLWTIRANREQATKGSDAPIPKRDSGATDKRGQDTDGKGENKGSSD